MMRACLRGLWRLNKQLSYQCETLLYLTAPTPCTSPCLLIDTSSQSNTHLLEIARNSALNTKRRLYVCVS